MFTQQDTEQLFQQGIELKDAKRQQETVKNHAFVSVVRPAVANDGVLMMDEAEIRQIIGFYEQNAPEEKIVKFVPASGAASRMFKDLHSFRNGDASELTTKSVSFFFEHLSEFAFFQALKKKITDNGLNLSELLKKKDYFTVIDYLLTEKGLNYAKTPKGLIFFHQYGAVSRTAFEEHWVEAAEYGCDADKNAHLHFTVSPEHKEDFEQLKNDLLPQYEQQYGMQFHIEFSIQYSATDTLAFAEDNTPFRTETGELVLRPGGHGSLIKNLNEIDADILFIKNIDNVCLDKYKKDTIIYKKLLVGLLLDFKKQIFRFLHEMEHKLLSEEQLQEIEQFLQSKFFISLSDAYKHLPLAEKQAVLFEKLNRPIRICGMVKREDEPGGGPFWVQNAADEISLQIVETSEMDLSDPTQKVCLDKSEFFNPVDLVCSLKNYRGKPFNLPDYVDFSRYFISEKSQNGKRLKAIENPGLWNGAMSDWLTVFVAVPLATFSPVKTVNDLIRKEHNEFAHKSQ
ncbi:MAG: DUF4301 family protein [Lentimicrobiaceae bacterium]|nr:DUF4301 family protein [Lentimicrobiaceae bacterium]